MLIAQSGHYFHHVKQYDPHLDYVCPQCELPVITENNEFRHFISNPKCGLKSESELHLITKKIINTYGVITHPNSKMKHALQSVELEKSKSMFYFDIFAIQTDDRPIIIEINYQSPITDTKQHYIQNQNIDALEIDISKGYNSDNIVEYVLNSAPRKWIWKSNFPKPVITEPDISRPHEIEHPIYTRTFLKNYIYTLRSTYPNLDQETFQGTIQKQHRITGLPKSIRYVLNCETLYRGLVKHICVLPSEYSFIKKDVCKTVSFRLSCDPNRFIYNPITKRSLFLPIAKQITPTELG